MLKTILTIIFLILISIAFYGITLRGVPGNPPTSSIKNNLDQATKPFELSPERSRYLLIQSLDQKGTLDLNKEQADAAFPDVGFANGKFYIFFAPGISLLALPFYKLGTLFNLSQVFSFATISLFATLNLVFIYLIAKRIFNLPNWAALVASLTFGFSSTAWSYATTLYQHHVTTFFIISSFYAVWKYNQIKDKNNTFLKYLLPAFVWLNYAVAILIDYPNAMLLMPVMIYFAICSLKIKQLKKSVSFSLQKASVITCIIFVLITGFHGYLNHINYGAFYKVSGGVIGYKDLKDRGIEAVANSEEIKKLQEKKTPVNFFREEYITNGLYTLLVAPDKGLLFFSPVFLFALLGIVKSLKKMTIELSVLFALMLSNLLLYASFGDPWGGWAFGPRYLIPSMAILSLFVGFWIANSKWKLLAKSAFLLIFTISSAISLAGALTSNAIPPKVEADFLHMKYNFLRNFDLLFDGQSSSFIYNSYFSTIPLLQFYGLLLLSLLVIMYLVLFVFSQQPVSVVAAKVTKNDGKRFFSQMRLDGKKKGRVKK